MLVVFVAENCSASHPGCEAIWNTDVQQLYSDLIEGSLSRDQLHSFCRFDVCVCDMTH